MRDTPYQPPKRRYTGSRSLNDLVRAGERLAVSCMFCRHFVRMGPPEIAELAKRLGDDFPTPDLPRVLKCSKCGSRRVDVRRSEAG
jgi:hypothetical protein